MSLALDKTAERQRITAQLWRLWEQAKEWRSAGFPGEPITVRLRDYTALAIPTGLDETSDKGQCAVTFRLTWRGSAGSYYVDLMVGFTPEGGPRDPPYAGVRILTGNSSVVTESDITGLYFTDFARVDMDIRSFCQHAIEKACRHKNEKKFFRYNKPVED